jgi:hypothetical protein
MAAGFTGCGKTSFSLWARVYPCRKRHRIGGASAPGTRSLRRYSSFSAASSLRADCLPAIPGVAVPVPIPIPVIPHPPIRVIRRIRAIGIRVRVWVWVIAIPIRITAVPTPPPRKQQDQQDQADHAEPRCGFPEACVRTPYFTRSPSRSSTGANRGPGGPPCVSPATPSQPRLRHPLSPRPEPDGAAPRAVVIR